MSKKGNNVSLGLVLLGSVAAVAGIAAMMYYNDDVRHRVEGVVNRERAKLFVKHKLNGSDSLVNAVDNLSDSEVNTIVKLASGAGNVKDQASDAFSSIMDRAKDMSSDVTDRVQEYFE